MFTRVILRIVVSLASTTYAEAELKPLAGRVVDEQKRPLAGAKVSAFGIVREDQGPVRKRELASATTGADGQFYFKAEAVEKCAVVVASAAGKSFDAIGYPLAQTDDIELQLGPSAKLDGLVVNDAGSPVAGADVKIIFDDLSPPPG